jgi:hypothetical protein
MYRMFTSPRFSAVCLIALAVACSKSPSAPSESDAGVPSSSEAAADGSTLKVHAPSLMSPINDVRLDNRQPTLVVANTSGRFVNSSYVYEFQLMDDGGNVVQSANIAQGSSNTAWALDVLEKDTPYRWRVRATLADARGPWSSVGRFITVRENRTPDPPPGGRLPVPNRAAVVDQIARQFPNALRNSCQEHGGSWEFMDRVVDALRLEDSRWGYNCKRGNCGDPSLDVVAYHHLAGPTFPGTVWIEHPEGGPGTNGFTSRGRW